MHCAREVEFGKNFGRTKGEDAVTYFRLLDELILLIPTTRYDSPFSCKAAKTRGAVDRLKCCAMALLNIKKDLGKLINNEPSSLT